ncbi:cadherin-5 isoform X2 [Clarias gariepinus]|uniref:cadherin-5 isoform X2 n=1 Tax=Clarias gariepinus TaxID=13013 RepID=UPI00234E2DC0|nr:cadherin-5 isoform X2 [Clarias gariepinus]
MMRRSVGQRAVRTFLCAVFLHFLFTAAEHVKEPSPSSVLHRQKRKWEWKALPVSEELPPKSPPLIITTLKNTLSNKTTEFTLIGDGAGDTFRVNKNGEVLLLKKLDREKISSYSLKAQLINSETKAMLEEDDFIIQVQDINDNTPVFAETYSGSVNERAGRGTPVLKVLATDKDDPNTPNGMVTYKLLNGTNFFSINPDTGEIQTAVDTLDRETQSVYKLLVQASDTPGFQGLSATTVVTININDINDNHASFSKRSYHFDVNEDRPRGFNIGALQINDHDEKQNKNPTFTLDDTHKDIFGLELNENNDGVLILKKELDYETKAEYTFTVTLEENVVQPMDNRNPWTTAQIIVYVKDVDEPPVFSQAEYTFSVKEGPGNLIVGSVSARDMDKTSHRIRYSIQDPTSPVTVNSETGQLLLKTALDREQQQKYMFYVTAQEESTTAQKSNVKVTLNVLDINDNDPELASESEVYICENDKSGTVIGVIGATDLDENPGLFRFTLIGKSSNFSLHDNLNNTASIILTHGGFNSKSSEQIVLEIEITDGGTPPRKSIRPLPLRVCVCESDRRTSYCMAYSKSGITVSALIAILLCIITILVIVILFVLRKRYQKEALVSLGKSGSEIHEQLVAYDEEGGGEMDTNIYDVSILTSARADSRVGPDPLVPPMYAVVNKPSACKGDMAVMIDVKKDEADHDRDGIPYDTLHIYGYEGSESVAGSLSSLESSSSFGSDDDYNFLSDWGPRFRTLAQIYGSDVDTSY